MLFWAKFAGFLWSSYVFVLVSAIFFDKLPTVTWMCNKTFEILYARILRLIETIFSFPPPSWQICVRPRTHPPVVKYQMPPLNLSGADALLVPYRALSTHECFFLCKYIICGPKTVLWCIVPWRINTPLKILYFAGRKSVRFFFCFDIGITQILIYKFFWMFTYQSHRFLSGGVLILFHGMIKFESKWFAMQLPIC